MNTCDLNEKCKLFANVSYIRKSNADHVMIGHLNVNSLGSKLSEIKELQCECKMDVLVLSETKLDSSYTNDVLNIDGYSIVRKDKRSNSGGLLVYISNDIPHSAGKINVCTDEIECISIELNIKKEKIMLLGMYKNPRTDPVIFKRFFNETCEMITDVYENIIIIGDLNFNLFHDNMLSTIMPSFNLTNVIKEATCFKSSDPTLIDVMLVTKRRKILDSFTENVGISDFHNLIGGILRIHKPAPKVKKVVTRKLGRIDYDRVRADLGDCDLSRMVEQALDVNCAYNSLEAYLCNLLDKHAPKTHRLIKRTDFHCMTNELKKAILYRNRLRNKYYKTRLSSYLTLYKIQRNKVTEMKRRETGKYFKEKCKSGTRNKDFWRAIKPLFSKSRTKSDNIPLRENNEIVTDEHKVCDIFNKFFQSIGSEIGQPENNEKPVFEIISHYNSHPSIKTIKENIRMSKSKFMFRFVTKKEVTKIIKALCTKKAAGYDEIPVQFIKNIGMELLEPLTKLINICILERTFPENMKKANITPLYKKKDKLNKDNFRSVNLLPVLSKILERVLFNQIYEYTTQVFHKYLSGFRKGHSCQDVLVRMTEDWRRNLDDNLTVGVVAIDLSKAFDCMPHGLLLAKLAAYGFDVHACELMKSYMMKRKQRVKIGDSLSEWVENIKGVPQGSILGPLLFNIFINDFLYFSFNSKIYNYADDNTLSCADTDFHMLKYKLHEDCMQAMTWFEQNNMKANAEKFQLMFLSRQVKITDDNIKIGHATIKASESINILGIELDNRLKLNLTIDEICSHSGKQINALKRIKHHLDKESKMIIYNSYINSNFNYCSVVWMLANKSEIDKLERTNKRALRFVTGKGNLSYEDICCHEKELSVYRKCIKTTAILMYKIRKGTVPEYLNDLFTTQNVQYNMRDADKFSLPQFKTIKYGKNSIRYLGAKLWNNIPLTIKQSSSLSTFKSEIHKWLLTCETNSIS